MSTSKGSADDSAGLRSYELPVSPRTDAGRMSVWVDGDAGVHMAAVAQDALLSPPPSPSPSPSPMPSAEFPLVLYGESHAASGDLATAAPLAIVPFQQLRMDTDLHQTLLPSSAHMDATDEAPADASLAPFAGMHNMDDRASDAMTHELMQAMRLHGAAAAAHTQEPQLSVRVRGSRVELAPPSDEDEVDFLGPAENIKKLFRLPYSQAPVSLAVHRVGRTLVVDGELDVGVLPAGFEDASSVDDRKTLATDAKADESKTDSAAAQQEQTQRLLYEKFIFQSAMAARLTDTEAAHADNGGTAVTSAPETPRAEPRKVTKPKKHKKHESSQDRVKSAGAPRTQIDRDDPIDRPSDAHRHTENAFARSAASFTLPTFQRVLKWKFNDLKMILGSEVLLFSNAEHPAVSLRLHDMDTELSLCTVLDYYLDNVIANIPELAICMHSNGVVRGYKLVETRQIPYLSGAGRPLFDVQEVSMNASMLLKFLLANCTRQNGTYWLYRKEGEKSLRLYDVDMLSQGKQLKWKYMMAMLCYRFASRASRMVRSLAADAPRLQQQLRQRQRDLLVTCLQLLEEIARAGGTAHPSVCASVSEQLADTYLRSSETNGEDNSKQQDSLQRAKNCLRKSVQSFAAIVQSASEDAAAALPDDQDGNGNGEDEDSITDGEVDGAVEMDSFVKEELRRLELKCASVCLQIARLRLQDEQWDDVMDELAEACEFLHVQDLPRNAAQLVDDDPADSSHASLINSLIASLDFEGVVSSSQQVGLLPRICTSSRELRAFILEIVGDASSKLPSASAAAALLFFYKCISGEERELAKRLVGPHEGSPWREETAEIDTTRKTQLFLAFCSYLRALVPSVDSELFCRLMKKLGNACNEMGKHLLSCGNDHLQAFAWFQRGGRVFADIEDNVNAALLAANQAHLHKILAQGKSLEEQEQHYSAAVTLCKDALLPLKQPRSSEDELVCRVTGELALTYLVWGVAKASCMRDRSADKQEENKVIEIFGHALTLYAELGDRKQVAATHYQTASFHSQRVLHMVQNLHKHKASQDQGAATSLRHRMEIARRHYEKALDYYGSVELGKTFVLIHQELSDLYAMGGRVDDLDHALMVLLNTHAAFQRARMNQAQHDASASGWTEDLAQSMAPDMVAKLKALLHQLVRLSSASATAESGGPIRPESSRRRPAEVYKQMFKEMLYYGPESRLVDVLAKLRETCLL